MKNKKHQAKESIVIKLNRFVIAHIENLLYNKERTGHTCLFFL